MGRFFDNYVIPLAKKLEECGVFGVSSDEYLNYAVQNRNEWEQRGEETLRMMTERFHEAREKKKSKGTVASVPEGDENDLREPGEESIHDYEEGDDIFNAADISENNADDYIQAAEGSFHSYTDH